MCPPNIQVLESVTQDYDDHTTKFHYKKLKLKKKILSLLIILYFLIVLKQNIKREKNANSFLVFFSFIYLKKYSSR